MSNHTRSRRFVAVILTVVTAIALSVVAFAAPANATSNATNAASVLTKFNAARLAHTPAESKLISVPQLAKSLQNYATYCSKNWASCPPGSDMACPGYDCNQPGGAQGDDFGIVRVASGSGATTRAANALIAYEVGTTKLLTWSGQYGPVGYVVNGSWTYVALEVVDYPLGPPVFTIRGKSAVGSQLTVTHSGFTTEPASIHYEWEANNVDVGTDAPTFTPTASNYNFTITVTVTWPQSIITGQDTEDAGPVALGTFTPPTHLVTGRYNVGQVLTAAPASAWTPVPSFLHYVWYRDGKAIALATESTYTVGSADKGHKIDLSETAEGASGSEYAVASVKTKTKTKVGGVTFDLPDQPSLVDITNDLGPFYHDKLSFTIGGAWSPAPTSLTYQWYRSGKAISGATHATYTPGTSDIHKIMTLKITAHKSGYVSASVTSASDPAWTVEGLAFNLTGAPTITGGSFTVGQTLTAHTGSWTPKPSSYTYAWDRDGVAIAHATKSTYKLVEADAGHGIDVVVTAKRTDYENGAANSDQYSVTNP